MLCWSRGELTRFAMSAHPSTSDNRHMLNSMRTQTADAPVLITGARHGRTLDVATRQRRYAWTMVFRTACFIGVIFVPGMWVKALLLVGAAVLPGIAVILANAADRRPTELFTAPEEPATRLAIEPTNVIRGTVSEEDRG